jgi:hypothetical protein
MSPCSTKLSDEWKSAFLASKTWNRLMTCWK